MIIKGFAANADIVGRRVQVSWDFIPEGSETIADIPPVSLRRKLRDFAYPAPAALDAYLVYDSSFFPSPPISGQISVTDLKGWEVRNANGRTVYDPVSVAIMVNGRMMEILRRTVATSYNNLGIPVLQQVKIVDTGGYPGNLAANTVYYYQLFSNNLPASGKSAESFRATAMVTDSYGLNRTLYESLPEIYRAQDVRTSPTTPGSDIVPEKASNSGQLRRFTDLFGVTLDSIRGTAEGLRGLPDIDRTDAKYLTPMSQWIGWNFSVDSEIPIQRNELKAAPRLYRLVGTLPGLRTLVSQYTGWFAQVAEFVQNVALANRPAQFNLFGLTLASDGVTWIGTEDASGLLGFGTGTQAASGTPAQAASLTGAASEPFALRAGMKFTVAADGLLPETVRFGEEDFVDISQATAAEVAHAITRSLNSVGAAASGGKVVLSSATVGTDSQLEITPESSSLISLEHAAGGRLSPATDSLGRTRLFFEVGETPSRSSNSTSGAGPASAAAAGNYVLRRLHYKTFGNNAWSDSHPVAPQGVSPQADPAAVVLPDQRLFVAWIENPQTAISRPRFILGTSRPPVPARLMGQVREPFALVDGKVLTLTGNWTTAEHYTVKAADFANVAQAKAAEVVAAMNAQLVQTRAFPESNGSIRIETVASGPQARIAIDLRRSFTARALGFDNRNAVGTPGSWDETVDWTDPMDLVPVYEGNHAETAAANDGPGGIRIAWASHKSGLWRIQTARWSERILIATANGLFARVGSGTWSNVPGLPSLDIRSVAVDAGGTEWIATAAGLAIQRSDGTMVTPALTLPSLDVRRVFFSADGSAWIATASGISVRTASGLLTSFTTADGLPSNDVRAVVVSRDGSVLAATGSGLAIRAPFAAQFQKLPQIPSDDVRDIVIGPHQTVYVATAAGLAFGAISGAFTTITTADGIVSSDIRAVALGPGQDIWIATPSGVSHRSNGVWLNIGTANGLPSNDTQSVALASDGSVWVGTAGGAAIIGIDGTVTRVDVIGGEVANPGVRAVHTGCSSSLELASGDASNREPVLVTDRNNQTWLIWSKLLDSSNDTWELRYRIYDPAAQQWSPETVLTSLPAGMTRAADRTASAQALPTGLRVYFASDRNGGFGLWSLDVAFNGAISGLTSITDTPATEMNPVPINAGSETGSATWVLFRSDANVSLSQGGSANMPLSQRVPDSGAVRRFAGTVSINPRDTGRIETRRLFGDLLCYTPNRPDGSTPGDDELYTRGTVGLYVSRARQGSILSKQEALRLRELLQQFLPVNLRATIIVVAGAGEEFVYPAGTGIQESYHDNFPFAEKLTPIVDASAAAMPSLLVIHSNTATDVSANPADLRTLRRRTFFPPLQ